jgi:hypothetical protein
MTGRAPNGLSPTAVEGQAPLVNWGVVGNKWHDLEVNLRIKTRDLESSLKQHTG